MLVIEDMRVDVGGVPDVDGITFSSEHRQLVILGGGRGLFEALGGITRLQRGRVTIDGRDPRALVSEGKLAAALVDVPLPPKYTALEYATWSGRLAGAPKDTARALAKETLALLGVDPNVKLAKPTIEIARATSVAGAIATGAKILVMSDPTEGLRPESARAIGRALFQRIDELAWIVLARRLPLASPMALHADEAIMIRGSQVVTRGAPAEISAQERSYTVRATGDIAAFAKLVEDSGGSVSGVAHGVNSPSEHMAIDLGAELQVRDLFALAEDAGAVVVEVLPLGRAFS